MTGAAAFTRGAALARLADEVFDVLVIGGGITGAGVALDAAARGLRTALVEAGDFASGTSSRSSKLVHGGLRYLGQHEYRLVAQALSERQRLLRNAPHLVRPLPFLLPLYGSGRGARTGSRAVGVGLSLYDLFGAARVGRHHRLGAAEALDRCPALRASGLHGAYLFYDAQADDARLTLAVARTAVLDHGAVALNHAPVKALVKDGTGRVTGARLGGDTGELEVRAAAVVNATGVWAGRLAALDDPDTAPALRPARGVHLAVPLARLPGDVALVVTGRDGRSVFVVPWPGSDRVYVGTTDSDHSGDLESPECSPAEVEYLLDAVNRVLSRPLDADDVVGAWCGLRPLAAGGGDAGSTTASVDLSRRHRLSRSPGGLVSVTGGKLTTYRRMAADAVDAVVADLGRGARRSPTGSLPLRGAPRPGSGDEQAGRLFARYGTEARVVEAMVAADPALAGPLAPPLPYLAAEAVYGVRYEMATGLDDLLVRRTRCLPFDAAATMAAAGEVARLVAPELGWTEARAADEAASFRRAAAGEWASTGLAPAVRGPG